MLGLHYCEELEVLELHGLLELFDLVVLFDLFENWRTVTNWTLSTISTTNIMSNLKKAGMAIFVKITILGLIL